MCSKYLLLVSLLVIGVFGAPQNVGVNIPGIYLMDLFTGRGGTNLGINVLNGLVRVGVDRRRGFHAFDENGGYVRRRPKTGVSVEAFNAPIYQGVH